MSALFPSLVIEQRKILENCTTTQSHTDALQEHFTCEASAAPSKWLGPVRTDEAAPAVSPGSPPRVACPGVPEGHLSGTLAKGPVRCTAVPADAPSNDRARRAVGCAPSSEVVRSRRRSCNTFCCSCVHQNTSQTRERGKHRHVCGA